MSGAVKPLERLKESGYRITRLREAMIGELNASKKLLSAGEMIAVLKKKKLAPHKTSVYRELDFLIEQGMVKKVNFGDKEDRFEFALMPHHHHAVCHKCGDVQHIDLEEEVRKMEHRLIRKQFKAERHLVEFFGLCGNCQ
ncbi:MAG TPA: Fur family transcriptional regulator [Methylococcaceae bacterium]|jgi:Fur family ferric uptake transcriptional regulator|nr:Fur family transcriptional regulator [Methylococcaceae bacterium]